MDSIQSITDLRISIENMIRDVKKSPIGSQLYQTQIELKLIEAKMWAGMLIGSIEGQKSIDISYENNKPSKK